VTYWIAEQAQKDFDILLDKAESEGPQWIVRGGVTYIVMTEAEYRRLAGTTPKELER
jgi:hypothetical protein